ncbi:MAG: competence/damage-inducible protein A, partial [Coriobacteriia bacterium]|nr:competence/damage-inducible protein A [Coriobacteriia bacterium]
MTVRGTAAIVTVGSELTEGLRVDTNTAEIARALSQRGFIVAEALSVSDDPDSLAASLVRLVSEHPIVITTGGLGPTHDDITREAAAKALRLPLLADTAILARLRDVQARHTDPAARDAVLTQALVLQGAQVLPETTGTAPGQIVATPAGSLVLLPGPPSEMRPMLELALADIAPAGQRPVDLGVTGVSESDVQHAAQRALSGFEGITLTVLAKPGDVRVLLIDDGAGGSALVEAGRAVAAELGDPCYTTTGETLAAATLARCREKGVTV